MVEISTKLYLEHMRTMLGFYISDINLIIESSARGVPDNQLIIRRLTCLVDLIQNDDDFLRRTIGALNCTTSTK